MDSRGYLSNKNGGNGAPEQILQLCKHIIKKDIVVTDPQLSSKIDASVKDSCRTSISYLNKAQSAQDDNTINEFSVAEKIKKYLVSWLNRTGQIYYGVNNLDLPRHPHLLKYFFYSYIIQIF